MKVGIYRSSKLIHYLLSALALLSVGLFAYWWFTPQHTPDNFSGIAKIGDIILFIFVSYVIWHPIIMDVLTWFIALHIKDIHQPKPISNLKVAFITTIVPSNEPVNLLHKCLPAMVKAKYPHDTWLLDEGNNPEVKVICDQYGVKHFSRNGINEYNTQDGKFTKTKGGNHNSWYDAYGNDYDIVAQIDTDFVPKSTFLIKTLGYFKDPNIAFVGTPQIYGNTQNSLIAQGAAEQQYNFYGSVLRGLSGMGMTLLIGANHVVRVKALKDIGHYSAHITEDLLTGMKFHMNGWKSVYVSEPLAVGEAPTTWEAYFNQQMRWAYGCTDILLHHSPKLFKKMGLRQTIYYFFLQQHYFSGVAMVLSIFLLNLYFFVGLRVADVDLLKFSIFYSSLLLICWLMSIWLQRYNVYRSNEGELLLAGRIIGIAVWPIWFLAFINVVLGKNLHYLVTPKGNKAAEQKTPFTIFIPHLLFGSLAVFGLFASFFTHRQNIVMLFWGAMTALFMLSTPFIQHIIRWTRGRYREYGKLLQLIYSYRKGLRRNNQSRISQSPITPPHLREKIADSVFLGIIVAASYALIINRLGFYSDDWSFLGNFSLSPSQTLLGLIKTATTPNTQMRPVQNIYDATLYWAFGIHPLGYQIVNATVFMALIILLYLILRKINIPRIIAVSIPLLYALLPNYSADRFWYAAFQANLSILLFLISFYAGLRAFSQHTTRRTLWKILSISSLLLSSLSYEVAMPFVLLSTLTFWRPYERLKRKLSKEKPLGQNNTIFIILTFIALIYILIFKTLTTTRLGVLHYPGYLFYIITSAIKVNYGTFILHLPTILAEIITKYTNIQVLLAGLGLYFVIFIYLYIFADEAGSSFPRRTWLRNLTLFSPVVFLLGYAIFFTNNQIGFSPTGVENRVAIAATVGVAMSLVGGFGWLCSLLFSERFSRFFYCIVIAAIGGACFVIINTLGLFWAKAYKQQTQVLSSIHKELPIVPKNTTVILDGVCPYVGPGVVFEADWDLKGALQVMYHDKTIHGDIVTPRLFVSKDGIHTQIYTFPDKYPYQNLLIYNYRNRTAYAIPNAQTAKYYFQKFNPNRTNGCPNGSAGEGVKVF